MTHPPPSDHDHREHARTTFGAPVVLEAGAGTGKTAVLVGRLVTWLIGPGWERHAQIGDDEVVAAQALERVLALTFTEKAAGEMASRLTSALELVRGARDELPGLPLATLAADCGIPLATCQTRAAALGVHTDRIEVTTIHAWCRRVLSAFPVEARLHPDFEVDAEGFRRRAVVDEVVAEWVAHDFAADGNPDAVALAAEKLDPECIWKALSQLAEESVDAATLAEDFLSSERLDDARAELLEPLGRLLVPVGVLLASGRKQLGIALECAAWVQEAERAVSAATTFDELQAAFATDSAAASIKRLKAWRHGKFGKTEIAVLQDTDPARDAARDLVPLAGQWAKANPAALRRAAPLLSHLLEEVRERLTARGIVSFGDLLVVADQLLAQDAIRDRLRAGLDQILVDEFQDTDARQYRLVQRLALDGDGERPGLFLVGDPKQSIYGWRQADLRAYDAFKTRLRERFDIEPRTLWVNFRSVPAVLDEVANIIGQVMEPEDGVQPPFQRLEAGAALADAPGFDRVGRRPIEVWVSWRREDDDGRGNAGPGTTSAAARGLEAHAIARDIRELKNADPDLRWRDVAVLIRTKTALDTYLMALRNASIPFLVEGDRNFYRRREVIDATNTIRCILDPTDHIALLAFLRSPTIGVPDAALIPLWERHFPSAITKLGAPDRPALEALHALIDDAATEVPRDVPGIEDVRGWHHSLHDAVEALAHLRQSFTELPADAWVEQVRRLIPIEATEAVRYLGEHRAANLERLFDKVLDALVSGEGGPDAVLRELRLATEDIHPEKDASIGEDEIDAVRVMTIHMAKGLDFAHVYLPDLHHGQAVDLDDRSRVLQLPSGRFEVNLMGLTSPGWHHVRSREREVRHAENVRLLYVAMTRAKQRLVLIGKWPDPHKERHPADARELIELIACRGDGPAEHLVTWADDLASAPAEAFDATGARWRLLDPVESLMVDHRTGSAAALDADAVAVRSDRLHAARTEAAARRDRPLVAAASSLSHEAQVATTRDLHDVDPGDPDPTTSPEAGDLDRPQRTATFARQIGTAVHRFLERLDLASDPVWAAAQALSRVDTDLAELLPPADVPRAAREARAFIESLASSQLIERLRALGDDLLGREVPLLLEPDTRHDGALGAIVGQIDLLYRDPATGDIVVADYKTDVVAEPELTDHARAYHGQGHAYVEAVRRALNLGAPPRFELWFLHHDRVVVV
ncbi:MAG: hypothetical protein CMJ83_06425 [Planctomycetes bacterium]|nr:hypothetical protein [Planctomycetota bacterium]